MFQHGSKSVRLRDNGYAAGAGSDNSGVRLKMPDREVGRVIKHSVGNGDEGRLYRGADPSCPDAVRGHTWLRRLDSEPRADDSGTVSMLFEFERQACVDIYSVMIAPALN